MVNPTIFRQYDIRGVVDTDLFPETVYNIGKGYGTFLRRLGKTSAVIGGDARLSTETFKAECIRGMREVGIDVIDIGMVASPVMYFAIWKLQTDGGIMITASHNPAEYNGIKMNLGLTSVFGQQIQDILKLIQTEDYEQGNGSLRQENVDEVYKKYIIDNIHLERPVKVVVDGGNGVGGPYLPEILRALGCEVIEMYCEPDGRFPNHHPDPTVEKYMGDLIEVMKNSDAEVGIGLDGDADRTGIIDEKGHLLYGDQMLNILVRDFLAKNPGERIIGDVKCSKNFFDDIKKHGGVPIMYKTGHANIKNKMFEEGIKVAGEMSGHVFLGDRYLGFDDAIYVGCRFVEIMSKTDKPVSSFLDDQPVMYNTPEIHVQSTDAEKFELVNRVRDSFIAEGCDVNTIDGMRLTYPDGWALCRASNTTPVLVLRFEAETPERLVEIQKLVESRIEALK
ncbi:MAG: phosphomannomutase/phosphoglucomutase [Candidatus Cloacimonetes bacterium]|nr:phosphomannomutase/phosphoglucomutase [Candidatus Cloacimonadota bacterium]